MKSVAFARQHFMTGSQKDREKEEMRRDWEETEAAFGRLRAREAQENLEQEKIRIAIKEVNDLFF